MDANAPLIKPLTDEDLPALAAIDALSSPTPWTESQFRAELNKDTSLFWTALFQGRVVGFAGLWLVGEEAQLANIALHPDVRGRGWGRRLLRWTLDQARSRGAVKMTLEVREGNAAARRLYGSEGFRETGRRPGFYKGVETALLLETSL